MMEPYTPEFESPYPQGEWSEITEFDYATPLYLMRAIEAVRREGKAAQFLVARPYTVGFKLDGAPRTVTVPQGMLTDLASIPAPARPLISQVGPHLEASIVHDFLYIAWQDLDGGEAKPEDRRFADKLMRVAMKAANVSSWKRFLIYNAVRVGGGGVYREREPEPRYVVLS
jgi:hypothetical protein